MSAYTNGHDNSFNGSNDSGNHMPYGIGYSCKISDIVEDAFPNGHRLSSTRLSSRQRFKDALLLEQRPTTH